MDKHERDAGLNIRRDGEGIALVWSHGLMSSMETEDALGWFGWDALRGFAQLIRYDARGHGGSGAARGSDAWHWRNLGTDMLAVAGAMNAPAFIAGGMSMGCGSAIHAAVQAPERIKGLILAMPPMIWEGRAAQRVMYQRIAQRAVEADGRALAKLMSRDIARTLPAWLQQANPGVAASLAIGVRALDRRLIPDMFHGAAISDLPARAALAAIAHLPALILAWRGDSTHPVQSAEELHRLLPRSELVVADGIDAFKSFPHRIRAFAARLGDVSPPLAL